MKNQGENKIRMQVGGTHYIRFPYEPIDFIMDIEADFCVGNIIKYISRYLYKNGVEDLKKALQYASFIIERGIVYRLNARAIEYLARYVTVNNLSLKQTQILRSLIKGYICVTSSYIEILIEEEYGKRKRSNRNVRNGKGGACLEPTETYQLCSGEDAVPTDLR